MTSGRFRGVFFDLDGTLLDTAPDLAYALNCVRREVGLGELPFADIRPHVSNGARALIALGFRLAPDDPVFEQRKQRLLAIYRQNLARETAFFPGIPAILDGLEHAGCRWGIITNKPEWLTNPLLEALGLLKRASAVVSGDTVSNRKPHPEPLQYAAACAGVTAEDCVYIGDARRDIEAAHAAGMTAIAAGFGYLPPGEDPASWNADAIVQDPAELTSLLLR